MGAFTGALIEYLPLPVEDNVSVLSTSGEVGLHESKGADLTGRHLDPLSTSV